MNKVEVILFDLGGVLIELDGVPTVLSATGRSDAEIRDRWIRSPAVREFESGQSSADAFAAAIAAEYKDEFEPESFIDSFSKWPLGPFEGAVEMLQGLSGQYQLGCLSNTNHLHWRRFEQEATLLGALDHHFASHLIGKLKPDPAIYHHVIEVLDCDPSLILFLDDNQVNVDGAIDAGMQAYRVQGIDEVNRIIVGLR